MGKAGNDLRQSSARAHSMGGDKQDAGFLDKANTHGFCNRFHQNVGNTCRHLLKKLAELVFDAKKHVAKGISFDTRPENFKNRLWAFVLYKFPESATDIKVREYAKNLLESSDKAINLSNAVTHAIHADSFLSQSCAISTITTVHLIKLANEMFDPS